MGSTSNHSTSSTAGSQNNKSIPRIRLEKYVLRIKILQLCFLPFFFFFNYRNWSRGPFFKRKETSALKKMHLVFPPNYVQVWPDKKSLKITPAEYRLTEDKMLSHGASISLCSSRSYFCKDELFHNAKSFQKKIMSCMSQIHKENLFIFFSISMMHYSFKFDSTNGEITTHLRQLW